MACALFGLLLGAGIGYLICVWMTGYFYSPFVPSPHMLDGSAGTRYVMLMSGLLGAILFGIAEAI